MRKTQSLSDRRLPVFTMEQGHCQHPTSKRRLACSTFDHGAKIFSFTPEPCLSSVASHQNFMQSGHIYSASSLSESVRGLIAQNAYLKAKHKCSAQPQNS